MNKVGAVLFAVVLAAAWGGASPPAQARGTILLLEGGGGIGVTDNSESVRFWQAAFGVGGKLRGFPPRFYFLVDYSGDVLDSTLSSPAGVADRTLIDHLLLFGPRLYLPLNPRIRIYFQGLLGAFWSQSDWLVNSVEPYQPDDRGMAAKFSAGLQFRPVRALSIGVGVDRVVFWGREQDPAVAAMTGFGADADDADQTRFGGTIALHF
ncbi:MAG: hypothetical protein FJ109_01095 [Deltaproteobacteria bacterium]|nr:hypothetical protein [Deltaproteobacteria bacterium]